MTVRPGAYSFGKPTNTYNNIAVIGAGLMGAGIAQVSAERDFRVILKDRDSKALARGEQQIYGNLSTKVKKRSLTTFERDSIMSRVIGALVLLPEPRQRSPP